MVDAVAAVARRPARNIAEAARTEDFDWPANLHLADVLEKHLARGLWDRINELEKALSDMAKLFDIEHRRVHNIDGKAWAIVPAAEAQRAYDEAMRVLKADGDTR